MKVLNLYSGIGGNRKLWTDVDVTAVEWDEATAEVYQEHFPDDTVIVADAHEYLLHHYKDYDFIWSSPPCPSHSNLRFSHEKKIYPDMKLYEEIIFLKTWFDGLYVIENVQPYYEPLIPAKLIGRHLFWINFRISSPNIKRIEGNVIQNWSYKDWERYYKIDLSKYAFNQYERRKRLRNMVDPEIGLHFLNRVKEINGKKTTTTQSTLFEL